MSSVNTTSYFDQAMWCLTNDIRQNIHNLQMIILTNVLLCSGVGGTHIRKSGINAGKTYKIFKAANGDVFASKVSARRAGHTVS